MPQYVFPVNALAFHPTHGTFATGGCDALVCVWDGELKKRVSQLPPYPTSIAALDFNYDGSLLAVASSYTWEEGEKEYVRGILLCAHVSATAGHRGLCTSISKM